MRLMKLAVFFGILTVAAGAIWLLIDVPGFERVTAFLGAVAALLGAVGSVQVNRKLGIGLGIIGVGLLAWGVVRAWPTRTLPPPSVEIFPQASEGEAWAFTNHGGLLSNEYVTDQNCRHSGRYGLRLIYDMEVGAADANGGWGVHWANAPAKHFNASGFTALTFWVKGTSGRETFQIGIKDTTGIEVNLGSQPLVIVSTDWTLVTVPLRKFTGAGVNSASIDNVHFGFNRDHGSGSICVDDIDFVP